MNNYQYCVDYAVCESAGRQIKVLDYGCGAGQIVCALLESGIDAYGCDVYYAGGDYSSSVPQSLWNQRVLPMEGGRIPFPDSEFDLIINNQVMEHVPDLDAVLDEIHRVTAPGGQVLSLFPSKETWREGHCGVPLIHWIRPESQVQIYYGALASVLGLGYHKNGKTHLQWSRDFSDWLRKWTHYRSERTIYGAYERHFVTRKSLETNRWDLRFQSGPAPARLLPKAMKSFLQKKLAGLVFVYERPPISSKS